MTEIADNVVFLPRPSTLTSEQQQHWSAEAAYWKAQAEAAAQALEYAERRREGALRILGLLALEEGLNG